MNKLAFLSLLRSALTGLPQEEIEQWLAFYSEMIEDRMDEGLSEEEAVGSVGMVEEIVAQILEDIPQMPTSEEKTKPVRRLTAGEVVLLVLGAPLWLPLLIAAAAVILSVYISLWSVVISLWAVLVSLLACAFGGVLTGVVWALSGKGLTGAALFGAGLVCAGLGILLFFGCKAATKGTCLLAKKAVIGVKNRLRRKGEDQ